MAIADWNAMGLGPPEKKAHSRLLCEVVPGA